MAKLSSSNNISDVILNIIETNGLNQSSFASMINVNQSQVSDWITGKSKPSYDSLKDICRVFNVSGDFLLGLDEAETYTTYSIGSRRYTGSKLKLMPWISNLIKENCPNCESFCDIFAGTGVVAGYLLNQYSRFVLNDFLYSNNAIYHAFFEKAPFDNKLLLSRRDQFNSLDAIKLQDNYVSKNYGGKFFSNNDARKIGYIRQTIEDSYKSGEINNKEYNILLASLLYSLDRCANTVGHYEAYLKTEDLKDSFKFNLIKPYDEELDGKVVEIFREDSNILAKRIKADIVYVDPPYSSRQYSRFYHVLETITKWDKPKLSGVAMKPPLENMSDYCSNSAKDAFADLISSLHCKYIVVSYNNTYNSKSSSSANKITLEDIQSILSQRGKTKRFEMDYKAFNAGKTNISNHKELIFITKVNDNSSQNFIRRSPFFYVGDKYKIMSQLAEHFPKKIDTYYDPFVGGGTPFLNIDAKHYVLNDIDSYMIRLHKMLLSYADKPDIFFDKLVQIETKYSLSASYRQDLVSDELKRKYPKTYFAKYNKSGYGQMKKDFNDNKNDMELLYTLLLYGFNRMLRFNQKGDFNLPVGNVDMNPNAISALKDYFDFVKGKNILFSDLDFRDFFKKQKFKKDDFIYLDPPYLISNSEYNKIWNEQDERDLLALLDELNAKGVRFAISNMIEDRGAINAIFNEWSKKYNVYDIRSNYINYHDNSMTKSHREVLVTNYKEE